MDKVELLQVLAAPGHVQTHEDEVSHPDAVHPGHGAGSVGPEVGEQVPALQHNSIFCKETKKMIEAKIGVLSTKQQKLNRLFKLKPECNLPIFRCFFPFFLQNIPPASISSSIRKAGSLSRQMASRLRMWSCLKFHINLASFRNSSFSESFAPFLSVLTAIFVDSPSWK